MIRIHCDAAHAVLKETEILTAGMLNYPTVQLTYTDELAPYGKAAIVRAGTVERAVAITEDSFLVPSECLANSGVNLIIGIRFVGSSSVIPTMWCDCGMIYDGADPDQGSSGEATQDLVDQMIAYAEQIAESAEAYDQSIIRQVIANASNANQYGTANVTVADTGSGSNRTLTFYFSNLKGNGIESVSWVTSGEYKGRLQIREVNGTVTNFDAFIQPLANIEAIDSTAEESAEAAATSESNAEAWAVGERSGTPVDSADETYHNNSKYYADQASDSADAALDAANRAIAATGLEIDTVLDTTSVNPVRNMAIAEAINNLNDGKVDKVTGKQLSTEDYTTTEKNKLAGIASGAQVNTITGVKGDAESPYRTGNVNLTPANIGAVPATRTVNGKALSSNVSLGASDVGAVPTTRTVNGKALSSNISLNSTDIIDDSDVGGSTVKASLNALSGSLSSGNLIGEIVKDEYINEQNGSAVDYVGWDRSGYIYVARYDSLKIYTPLGTFYNYWYDKNKQPLQGLTLSDGDNTVAVPTNAEYLMVSNRSENLSSTTVKGYAGSLRYVLSSTGDSTDRYSDIMRCLNTYGVCILGNGVFCINSTIGMPDNTTLSGVGVNTVLQLADSSSGQVAVNVGSYCLVKDMTIKGHSTELSYSSYTRGKRKAIAILGDYTSFNSGTTSHNFAKLSNLTITDFDHSGIWANKNDGAASFLAENIDILRCHTGIYIEFFSEFHSFTNVRCRHCNIACVMQGGNNIFTNCHFAVNLSNVECDDSQGTLVNAAHSTFVACTFCHPNNNTGHNVWVKGTANGWIFSDCQFWYGIIRFEDASGIILTNNIIGGTNNTIIIARCTSVNFCNNIFKTQAPILNLGSTTGLSWENNRNPDGTLNIVSDNGQISTQVFQNYYSADTASAFDEYDTSYIFNLTYAKNVNNVSLYLRVKAATTNGQLIGTLKRSLRPFTDWAMLGLYGNVNGCYVPVGSVWIKTDGKIYVYKNVEISESDVYYCFGSYVAYKS